MPKRKFKSIEIEPLVPSLDFITDPNWKPENGTILVLYHDSVPEATTPFCVVQREPKDKAIFKVRLISHDEKVVNLKFRNCERKALKVTPNESSGRVSPTGKYRDLLCRCRLVRSKAIHAWKVDITDTCGATIADCFVKEYSAKEEHTIPYYTSEERGVEEFV